MLKEKTRPKESTVELLGKVQEGMRVPENIWDKYGRELQCSHTGFIFRHMRVAKNVISFHFIQLSNDRG